MQGPAIRVVGKDGPVGAELVDQSCRTGRASQLRQAAVPSSGLACLTNCAERAECGMSGRRPTLVARESGGKNGNVRTRWRRWIPGPRHGLARGVAMHGVPRRSGPRQLDELPGRCDQLRAFARARGFELDASPEDIALLDQAIDEATSQAHGQLGGPLPIAALTEAGPFLGSVIVATVAGARWRL